MIFGKALEVMRRGEKVQREEWSEEGVFLFSIAGDCWDFTTCIEGVDELDTLPFICMKTLDNKLVPWMASQTDLLADDWQIVLTASSRDLF